MNPLWVDIIGWLGGLLVVIAYFMNTSGRMDARNTWYQLLNLSGSIFLIINTVIVGAYPSTAVNVIWVFIALAGLWKSTRKQLPGNDLLRRGGPGPEQYPDML